MGWGSNWDNKPIEAKFTDKEAVKLKEIWEKSKPNDIKFIPNKFPTHDPYTNPGAFLYYECDCGQVLDPKVKSFASLNNHASQANWKIRWGAQHYVPYCPKCVVEKGIE